MFWKRENGGDLKISRGICPELLDKTSNATGFPAINEIEKSARKGSIVPGKIILLIFLLLFFNFPDVFTQDSSYKINKKDLLELSFWEYPEMDSQVRVNNDGTISLPLIGNIQAEGLTIPELNQKIVTQMGNYNKVINQVNIKVLEFSHNQVSVTGSVVSPGKYYFEEIPNIWAIITEAGGPLEDARLDEVLIIRNQDEGAVITAEVGNALKQGKLPDLPAVLPGDAVHVTGTSSPFQFSKYRSNLNEFYIIGAVGSPGAHQFINNLNILDAIGRAGGPTSDANLTKVRYIDVYEGGTKVKEINLKHYFNSSQSTPLLTVNPGSTVFVPRKIGFPPFLATVITTAVVSAITAYIYVNMR